MGLALWTDRNGVCVEEKDGLKGRQTTAGLHTDNISPASLGTLFKLVYAEL